MASDWDDDWQPAKKSIWDDDWEPPANVEEYVLLVAPQGHTLTEATLKWQKPEIQDQLNEHAREIAQLREELSNYKQTNTKKQPHQDLN